MREVSIKMIKIMRNVQNKSQLNQDTKSCDRNYALIMVHNDGKTPTEDVDMPNIVFARCANSTSKCHKMNKINREQNFDLMGDRRSSGHLTTIRHCGGGVDSTQGTLNSKLNGEVG